MIESILVAGIGIVGSGIGAFAGIVVNSKMTNYRLEQLEKKVEKHNNVIERITTAEEKIKVINYRLKDLEER